ncbi:MAG: hypothetical protein LKJ88_05915 [Bacilli bacterium]|jgi:hypothetical protein|nr:hypothetical protein [Bacilli bacterium]
MKKDKNKEFARAFAYEWPLYIVLPLIGGLTISYLLRVRHLPAPYEKLNLFVAASKSESEALSKNITLTFKEEGLKETTISQANPADSIFLTKLSVVGYQGADLFLLPYSVLKDIKADDYLLRISDELKAKYLPSGTNDFYTQDGYTFGVKLKSANQTNWLTTYISFLEEDYYLSLNVKSQNIGSYGLYDNPNYDLALKTMGYLLKGSL